MSLFKLYFTHCLLLLMSNIARDYGEQFLKYLFATHVSCLKVPGMEKEARVLYLIYA